MSHYMDGELNCRSEAVLIDTLVEMGIKREHIEIHQEAVHLYGYRGDKRPQKANIVVRRRYVGSAANDIGFEKMSNGKYRWHISENEYRYMKYGQKWLTKLQATYGIIRAEMMAKQMGLKTRRVRTGNKIVVDIITGK